MSTNLSSLIAAFADRHIVVIGEAMLDSYLMGEATRLCQEAPVPVVALHDRRDHPGGAANVAVNLCRLGARVSFLSVLGDDGESELLQQALERGGIETDRLLRQPLRRTLVKTTWPHPAAFSRALSRCRHGREALVNRKFCNGGTRSATAIWCNSGSAHWCESRASRTDC